MRDLRKLKLILGPKQYFFLVRMETFIVTFKLEITFKLENINILYNKQSPINKMYLL